MYTKVDVKPDDAFNPKVIYLCQTLGCGCQISEFPAAEKNPAPKRCDFCKTKANRDLIESEFMKMQSLGV